MSTSKLVTVIGQGYVGLPLAVEAAKAGHMVWGYEVDKTKVDALNEGRSYIEDITDKELRLVEHHYKATADADEAFIRFDVAVITVPTPLKEGVPDLSYVEAAARTIAPYLCGPAEGSAQTVILESTTYPGTTEEVLIPLLEAGSGLTAGRDFYVGFSPERIRPGDKVWGLDNTPKVVSGITEASLRRVTEFYSSLCDTVVPVRGVREAEMTKIFENTFMQVNIALVNEFARVSHEMGLDFHDVLDAAATKPHGFYRFNPGPGVGGHCLPIDPLYLSHEAERTLGHPVQFIDLADQINSSQPAYVVQRLQDGLNELGKALKGSQVLVLGVAYKPNVADLRETPAAEVVTLLGKKGAVVEALDPLVDSPQFAGVPLTKVMHKDDLADFDAVVLITDHDAFDYDLIQENAQYVLDCRNRLSGALPNIEKL